MLVWVETDVTTIINCIRSALCDLFTRRWTNCYKCSCRRRQSKLIFMQRRMENLRGNYAHRWLQFRGNVAFTFPFLLLSIPGHFMCKAASSLKLICWQLLHMFKHPLEDKPIHKIIYCSKAKCISFFKSQWSEDETTDVIAKYIRMQPVPSAGKLGPMQKTKGWKVDWLIPINYGNTTLFKRETGGMVGVNQVRCCRFKHWELVSSILGWGGVRLYEGPLWCQIAL